MKKRLLPALLALAMVLSLLPLVVFATDPEEVKITRVNTTLDLSALADEVAVDATLPEAKIASAIVDDAESADAAAALNVTTTWTKEGSETAVTKADASGTYKWTVKVTQKASGANDAYAYTVGEDIAIYVNDKNETSGTIKITVKANETPDVSEPAELPTVDEKVEAAVVNGTPTVTSDKTDEKLNAQIQAIKQGGESAPDVIGFEVQAAQDSTSVSVALSAEVISSLKGEDAVKDVPVVIKAPVGGVSVNVAELVAKLPAGKQVDFVMKSSAPTNGGKKVTFQVGFQADGKEVKIEGLQKEITLQFKVPFAVGNYVTVSSTDEVTGKVTRFVNKEVVEGGFVTFKTPHLSTWDADDQGTEKLPETPETPEIGCTYEAGVGLFNAQIHLTGLDDTKYYVCQIEKKTANGTAAVALKIDKPANGTCDVDVQRLGDGNTYRVRLWDSANGGSSLDDYSAKAVLDKTLTAPAQ